MVPAHWKVQLEGFGKRETSDVITRVGEVVRTWSVVDDVVYTFTPDGAEAHIFFELLPGMLCTRIAEWLRDARR
jgi:hypothetical protein